MVTKYIYIYLWHLPLGYIDLSIHNLYGIANFPTYEGFITITCREVKSCKQVRAISVCICLNKKLYNFSYDGLVDLWKHADTIFDTCHCDFGLTMKIISVNVFSNNLVPISLTSLNWPDPEQFCKQKIWRRFCHFRPIISPSTKL